MEYAAYAASCAAVDERIAESDQLRPAQRRILRATASRQTRSAVALESSSETLMRSLRRFDRPFATAAHLGTTRASTERPHAWASRLAAFAVSGRVEALIDRPCPRVSPLVSESAREGAPLARRVPLLDSGKTRSRGEHAAADARRASRDARAR